MPPRDPDIFKDLSAGDQPAKGDAEIFVDVIEDSEPQRAVSTPAAPRGLMERFIGDDPIRQLALGSRAVGEGVLTLPMLAGDAINSFLNYGIKGINAVGGNVPYLPSATQSLDAALTKAGAPVPANPSEKLQFQISKAAAGGVAFPAMSQYQWTPTLQGISGGVSGGVTQHAEDIGVNPVFASGLGLLAGMAVPSSPDIMGIASRGSKAAVKPFSEGGREEVVGNALVRMATRPRDAAMRIGSTTDEVSELTTAQASRDPGLLATERGLANLPGSGGRISHRYAEQNQARRALLDSMAKSPEELKSLKDARSADASKLYEPAFNAGPLKPTEELIALSKRPAFKKAYDKAAEIAGNEGLELGDPMNTMRGLHYLKMGVDDLVNEARPGTNDYRALVTMKHNLLGVMDEISPAYKTARETFAQASKPINRMELLQELRGRTLNSGLDVQGNRILSQAKWTSAVTDSMEDLKKALSPEQISSLKKISRDLDYGKLSEMGGKVSGSNTFQNLSVANVLGSALGKEAAESPFAQSLLRPLGFLYKLPERQVEELMIEAMLDKNLAMRLMSRATEKNISALATGLSQRLKASSKGSLAGQLVE